MSFRAPRQTTGYQFGTSQTKGIDESVEIAEVLAEPTWRIANSIALAQAEGNWEFGELLQKFVTSQILHK